MVKAAEKKEIKPKKTAKKAAKTVEEPKVTEAQLTIPIYGLTGKEEKTIELPEAITKAVINRKLIAQYVHVYLANQRQGTASTKTRGEVNGTTKKVYRQKGTGRARHGAAKGPIFVGGGITHAPKPRDYSKQMNKKQRQQVLFSVMKMKTNQNSLLGLADGFMKMEPKTKTVSQAFKIIGVGESTVLLVLPRVQKDNLVKATRNLSNIEIMAANQLNPYTLLNHEKVIFVEEAIEIFKKHFIKS